MNVEEMGWVDVDWIALAEDRSLWQILMNTVMNLHIGNFLTNLAAVG
jgi:hypothetical protein